VTDAGRYRCCDVFDWTAVVDFGHVAGVDLDLGRCGSCGMYLMAVFEPQDGTLTRVCLTNAEARRFLSLQGDPAVLKAALEAWLG
jgi:hypothetical protein